MTAPSDDSSTGNDAKVASLQVSHYVHEFFVLRDVLFVRIFVQRRQDKQPGVFLRWWDGALVAVAITRDKFHPTDEQTWALTFSHTLPHGGTAEQVAAIALVVDYDDGRFELRNPASEGVARDKFLSSEQAFWAAVGAKPDANVLEIGSRNRSGIVRRDLFPGTCSYTGFDVMPGENVNVVGDAHTMSRHLPPEHFDFVFSVSVWEHLSMPWLVSLELNKVMRLGGLVMINTHQAWPLHEQPCDYFRFSEFAWDGLFNAATGFEIVDRGMGLPCVMRPSLFTPAAHDDGLEWHHGYLASRVVARKIGSTSLTWPVDPAIVTSHQYPK